MMNTTRTIFVIAVISAITASLILSSAVQDTYAGKRKNKECSSNSVCGQTQNANGADAKNGKIKGQGNGGDAGDNNNNNNNDVNNGGNGGNGGDTKNEMATSGNGGDATGGNGADGEDA